jgi:hypothetical protein
MKIKEGSIAIGIWKGRKDIDSKELSDRLRDLTVSWLRFGYKNKVFEGETEYDIIEEARANGFSYCLLIPYGNILVERWVPNTWGEDVFSLSLESFKNNNNFILASSNGQSDCTVELINIELWESAGRPDLNSFCKKSNGEGQQMDHILPLPKTFLNGWINLNLNDLVKWPEIKDFIISRDLEAPSELKDNIPHDVGTFINSLENQTKNSRKGVFLWNLESYEDVEEKPENFKVPVGTLFSVTAGFKPNRILETHGFDSDTKMVFYDYSSKALEVRKMIVNEWDGIDFPLFCRKLMKAFPHPETFYQLWSDVTPDTLNWDDMDDMWENELKRWGGAENFHSHWQKYRSLTHIYVRCDLWSQRERLIELMGKSNSEIIWWSNAFFTIYGNWKYDIPERKQAFQEWMTALSNKNRDLVIYGSDHINTSLSGLNVEEYINLVKGIDSNELNPLRLAKVEIRM